MTEARACICPADLGKPRLVGEPDADAAELATWRQGMRRLAQLPQVDLGLGLGAIGARVRVRVRSGSKPSPSPALALALP